MKKIIIIIFIFLISNKALAECISSIDMSQLRKSVASKSMFYGDISCRVNCSKPQGKQKIICQNDVLRFMEKLDHMSAFYAHENRTKSDLDRSKLMGLTWLDNVLKKCDSKECICLEYKKNADILLGGTSPYKTSNTTDKIKLKNSSTSNLHPSPVTYKSKEDIGYEWAKERNIHKFSDCQYQFGTSDQENGCNKYVRESLYGGTLSFRGYRCTEDCSGHEAGYKWAEDNNINDEYDCESSSDSFTEGCIIYVKENN